MSHMFTALFEALSLKAGITWYHSMLATDSPESYDTKQIKPEMQNRCEPH